MALISAEEFKKNKGKTTTSPSSPSGLISADEFKRQKVQQSAQRIQDTASAISSAASAVGDFIGGAWDSFRQSARERSAQPVTPSPSSPVSHDDIKSGRVQIQPTGSLGAVDPNLRPDTSPRTIQEELAKRQSDRANILPDNALGQFAQNIYREADRFLLENPIGAFITRFGQQGAAALGQAPMHELPSTGSRAADVAADVGGTLASLAVNPGGVTSIAPGQASILGQTYQNPAVQMAATAAGARFSNPTASRIASEAVREGITGAVEGGAMALARGGTEQDALRDAALGGALGGAIGGAVPLVTQGARRLMSSRTQESVVQPRRDTSQTESPSLQRDTRPTETAQETFSQPRQVETQIREQTPLEQATGVDNEFLQIAEEATQPRIRDRVYNYLDEAEQAARERIAKRRNRLSANPIDEWGDYAIIMAAKVGKGTIKLADFTEELVREFGENVRPYANQILRRTKEELRKQTRRATKEADEAIRFNDQPIGNADTFRSKVDRSPRRNRQSFSQKWEQVRSQFIDDLAPLEGLEKRVRGDLASAEDSLYKAARLFKGVPSKANNIVQTRLAPIAQMVQQAGHTMEDLGDYALAMHARDVNASYMKSGFTNAEINDVIQKLGTPELEAARQQLVQLSNEMLNELVDAQVISRELADTLMERWPNYVPLFRSFDDDVVQFESGLSQALANVASPIKTLKGSERRVVDPIENVIKNVFRSVNAAERNRVALQLARLAEETGAEGLIRRLDPNEKVGRKNVVNVKMNGENVKFEVEPEVYKAMLNLDQESSTSLIRFLSKPASLLRAGATLTPEFSLRNPMRDIVQAFVVSESGFNPLIDFPVGLIETIRGRKGNSQLYTQWINDLGDFGNIMSMDRKVHREAMNKVLKQSPSRQFVNIINPASWIRLLRAISDTTESATKLGEYRAALRSGASRQEAAYRSRDIMDFARAGSSIRQWNKIVAFLNANIQGKSKILRAIKKNPVGVITRGFTSITLPTIAAFVMQKYFANETQQNTIEEAPDWMKDTFWLVPIPGTDTVARIPKPFDLSPIFSNLPERTLEYVYNNDREAFDGFVRRSLGDMALPVQITGLWPFVEGMANYSWFRESQIIPMREQNLEYRDQFDPVRTSETARLLARGAEAITGGEGTFANFSSPRIMENTIQGLTAGLGRYATDAIDAILKGMGTSDRPEAPERRLEQQPLLRAFTVDPMQSSKTLDKFYSQKEKLTNARNSARINEKPFENEQEYRILNQAGNVISDINKSIRTIESSDLTPREKRQRIEELQKQRLTIARRALEQLERVQ